MHRFPRFGRRLVVSLLAAGVIVPAVTLAQTTTTSKKDSTSGDSTTTHAAAGKRARFGALGRSALNKANSAADKVAQTTGVSKETMAQAALASTGVGAAAMLAKPGAASGAGTTASKVGAIVGQTAVQRMQQEQAARAARAATGAMPTGAAGMTAEQMALYRQQAAMQQAGAGGGSAEMQKLQADYMQLVMRAQSGDTIAVKQLMRFQQEMTTVGLRMQGVAPDKQQAVYESALRDALQCATSNRQCHGGRM